MDVGWDWTRLSHYLPSDILQRIASMALITEEVGDRKLWIASKTGKFSIQSALRIIRAGNTPDAADWRWIWRIRVPYRTQMFLWLLLHNKLLTNVERFRRHMVDSPRSAICSADEEDLDHLFRYCTNAIMTWQGIQASTAHEADSNERGSSWLQNNLSNQLEDPSWPKKFLITLWCIWKWRCMICFGSLGDITEGETPVLGGAV